MSKVNTKLTALIAPLSLAAGLAIATSAFAEEYLADSQGENVVNSYEECWEVSYGLPNCGEERYTLSGDGLFDFNKATIRPDLAAKLDDIIANSAELKSKGYSSIVIVGHTDSVGSDAYNQGLSERRAASTADYLVSRGIPRDVITTSGMGESQPVATNETAEGRQLNRRVEITID
ncbi:MAG: OmpA family protein [Gammaproteobacteria bacterium]|jgi:outer membrane protein OmpA-like peptidoglycan-associated protein